MARNTISMLTFIVVLAGAAPYALAAGLLRRVPEPGEWCRYDTGKLAPFKASDGIEFSGELSFWHDDKTAFGVLAAEYLFQVRPLNEKVGLPPGEFAIQLDCQESGPGAVTKLPEQK